MQMRGASIVRHFVGHSKELAQTVLHDDVFQILDILTKLINLKEIPI